ncbi:Ubiquitin carboxyl-terminal hydrolase family protein [Candida parapsilosis]|uniref:Ubiquitin carboxyl-terminal hydrolase n=1 Tax=Candida parapsilosis TaxID=5480 RepID=A0A8X7TDM1_CANPA|nr:Ubiquitin carboxyl-terminal hydrolase family protein [Candida parapsilosis]KAF6056677.1 Ubiquitin carboxyl-terminal hydrolase family protein [Candida parapsilosis]KAF6059612.1 Ubiquitin carboxyl-terminal hydrolase family protein [Candida parapsilosis]KAF6068365.1 Ubiquitin carboxyl-terminal hydrolase family protein [Candida parapsilosis]
MVLDLPPDIPSHVPANSKIYKDDCMYTFDTAENNELGLDIDLKTYRAYSRNKEYNYTAQNYEATGNYLYLNINKTLKPKEEIDRLLYDDEGEKSQKIRKLEIKNISEDDYFNTEVSLYNVKEDKLYPRSELSPAFNNLFEGILNANSSNEDEEIKQWEQEIVPCPHSINVEQFDFEEKPDLTKCSQCDLKENLWICLHCGALGCGRQQYGSTMKGNSHALAHYDLTQHPVALKLGSLSGDSESYDAYCYQCNDEVKVPNLAVILNKYGIDLEKTKKTEKSLVELNIDQNLSWDFKLDGAEGDKLPPVYGKGLTGLKNLGNSCYMNSVLQALFDLDSYRTYFQNMNPDIGVNPAEDLASQLLKIYDGLYSGRYSVPSPLKGEDYQLGVKPFVFKNLIGQNHAEFKTQRQQDANEFLLYLLDKLDNEFGLKLNQDLKFVYTEKVICDNCKHGSLKNELLDNISVPLEETLLSTEEGKKIYKEVDLRDSFKKVVGPELIPEYNCDSCHAQVGVALKSSGFTSFPKYLIVSAQRIKLENWTPAKVDVPVKIPYELVLSEFTAPYFKDGEIEESSSSSADDTTLFTPNADQLNTLLGMGFPEPRAIKALYRTGNNDAETAMNWLFEHMEDADIDDPLDLGKEASSVQNEPADEVVDNLVAMGFSHQLSKKALLLNNSDANAAVEWLFSHPDDDGVIAIDKPPVDVNKEKQELIESLKSHSESSGLFKLKSVICHKGTSSHTGHYVVFVRKYVDGKWKWVLFNDEKVVLCQEENLKEVEKNAYIYIFEQV